jgi:multimeric flavodoxin WrbA
MTEPVLSKEGQEILGSVLNMTPPILKEARKKKILRILSLLMCEQGVKEAGRELLIEALRMALSELHSPILDGLEDPAKFKRLASDWKYDLETYYSVPRQVKRWAAPPIKPLKPPGETKVIAFNASPRKGGNTDVLIDEALRGAKDAGASVIEKIMLQEIKLGFCVSCWKGKDLSFPGFCTIEDDMPGIFQKMADSDAIIIGFPYFMGRECGQLATFLDRWHCFRRPDLETRFGSGKRAMVIGTWGYPYPGTYDHIIENIIDLLQGFHIVTVEVLSACGFHGMLYGLDDKEKAIILRTPKELEKAYQAGKTLVTG